MLEFPREYFQDEEKEGFLVDAAMKTVWAAELEVLNEVAAICARHGLQWYAAYGTLLGAVRHQGFIPWDDDIDIWMKREDYRQILELLPEELPEGYVVRAPHVREGYPEYQVYVNNSDSISVEPERLQRFHGCPFYVGIDIFPLDIIPDDQKSEDMQRSIFASALMLQQMEHESKADNSEGNDAAANNKTVMLQIGRLLEVLKEQYGISFDRHLLEKKYRTELLFKLWDTAEKLGYQSKESDERRIAMYLDYLKYGKAYKAEWFEKIVYLTFEGFDIPVPENYDAVLKTIYGDYRKCVRSKASHDYPCYKRQLEELRAKVAEIEKQNRT